jgi:hypothetical protein
MPALGTTLAEAGRGHCSLEQVFFLALGMEGAYRTEI